MKRYAIYTLLAAGLVSFQAQANELEPQWYGGLGMGMVNFLVNEGSVPTLTGTSSVNSTSYNINIFAGYQFDPFLGLELNYLGGGSVTATNQAQTTKLFDVSLSTISATMGVPLNDSLRLYAKLGGTSWKFSSPQGAGLNDGFGPSVGLGANINLFGGSDRMLRIEYNYYHLDKVYVRSASNLSINAVFKFR